VVHVFILKMHFVGRLPRNLWLRTTLHTLRSVLFLVTVPRQVVLSFRFPLVLPDDWNSSLFT